MSSAQVYPRTGKSISRPLSLGPAPSPPKLAKAFWDRSVSYGVEATTTTFTTTAMNAAGDKTDYRGSCCVPSSIGGGAGGGRPAGGGGGGPTSIGIQIDLDAVVASPTAVVVDSVRRSVPDRILDMLVSIDNEVLIKMQQPAIVDTNHGDKEIGQSKGDDTRGPKKATSVHTLFFAYFVKGESGTGSRSVHGIPATAALSTEGLQGGDASVFCATAANTDQQPTTTTTASIATADRSGFGRGPTFASASASASAAPVVFGRRGTLARGSPWRGGDGEGLKGRQQQRRRRRRPVWQIAAILLARSRRSGYAKQTLLHFGILFVGVLFLAFSFRATTEESGMLHLVFSVLVSVSMPVLFMYHPLMITNTRKEWAVTKVELVDGLYPPTCVTVKVVFDHLAIGVIGSFSAVGLMHAVYWRSFISQIPASWLGVNIQLSCGATLVAWLMIALFDSLAVSGLPLSLTHTVGVTLNVSWSFFSGTVLVITTIPTVLKIVTYSSPIYWGASFMLRVMLDGLDMTGDCVHDSPIYCAAGYGDLVAGAFDLHARRTGLDLLAMAAFTCAGLALLVVTIQIKGRQGRALEGLRGSPSSSSSSSSSSSVSA